MKITRLELKNFKRFDDLTIDLTALKEAPKLVLLIGTNGSGKSSVFDAFEVLNKMSKSGSGGFKKSIDLLTNAYYLKGQKKKIKIELNYGNGDFFSTDLINNRLQIADNAFYGRTSIRQIPKLVRTTLGIKNESSFVRDTDRPQTYIDRDNRFENDIEKVTSSILNDVFNANLSTPQIRESYINPINSSFENIFGIDENTSLRIVSLKPPLDGQTAEILFTKGTSQIRYDYLSSGEKEIFNILLNLLTRREYFQDTVYFMDELDLHLNTQLQKSLIKEITENWIPENCQLWTASHSLGFIEYANEADHAAIVDFDNLNFDIPQVIHPSPKNNFDVFEIAVSKEFLSTVFEGKRIIFSENTDTPLYNNLNIAETIFFNAKDKADVFYKAKNNPTYSGLVDRDYLTDEERAELMSQYSNLFILGYYSIENYLYHPENLLEYYQTIKKPFNKHEYLQALLNEKVLVKDRILMSVARARDGYPFYRENQHAQRLKLLRSNELSILDLFNSDDFETFYKVFPAKDYGTELKERKNIKSIELARTNWFKTQIEALLIK